MTLRALIVDDEAPARKRLRDLIDVEPDLTVVGECDDGPSAISAIRALRPDVLFLDVQMPEMSGFDVLEAVGLEAVPSVVFVTAHDTHALAAFDARAIDYLLKPFTRARFREAVHRVRAREERAVTLTAEALRGLLRSRTHPPERIAVRDGAHVHLVRPAEIDWVESDGNYVRLHTGAVEHRTRGTLKSIADRLAPLGFVRIHQSYLVNIERVRELRPWSHGEVVVVLEGGKTLVSSRSYAGPLRDRLERGG